MFVQMPKCLRHPPPYNREGVEVLFRHTHTRVSRFFFDGVQWTSHSVNVDLAKSLDLVQVCQLTNFKMYGSTCLLTLDLVSV